MKNYKTSDAFEASLSFGFKEEKQQFDIRKEDFAISKYAGVNIYQPTVDNIENFVHKYTLSELSNIGAPTVVRISVAPMSYNVEKSDYVNEGQGVASVKIKDATLELPFMIMDGEFIPFDIIKLDNQRVPYSRENIKKIIHGIYNGKKSDSPVEEFKPYLGTEKSVNTTSSIGFLGDILRIQDQEMSKGNPNGNYVTANKINDGIEKIAKALDNIATMKVTTDKDWEKLAEVVKVAVTKREVEKLAKEAEELKNEKDDTVNIFTRLKDINFENASSMPSGSCVAFPEISDEAKSKEISMNQGVIISDYISVDGVEQKHNIKVVVTKDNKMKILNNNERFLCKRIKGDGLKLPSVGIESLNEGDVFVAFDGDKALYPSRLAHIKIKSFKIENGEVKESDSSFDNSYTIPNSNGAQVKILTLRPVTYDDSLKTIFGDTSVDMDYRSITLVLLDGQSFNELPYEEFIKVTSKKIGLNEMDVIKILPRSLIINSKAGKVFVTDGKTLVTKIKGVIKGYLKNPEDLHDMVGSTEGDFQLFKSAATTNNIEIRLADKYRETYHVKVNYVDKSKAIFKAIHKDYQHMAINEVRGVLKVLNFDSPKISEILQRAKNEPFVTFELPQGAEPGRLEGAQVSNRVDDTMKFVREKVVNKDVVDAVAADVLGALVAGAALSSGVTGMAVFDQVSKFAKESQNLSTAFEKIAIEKRSEHMRDVAAIMTLATHFNEKLAEVSKGKVYAKLNEVVDDIVDSREFLEKTASSLIELKHDQYKNRNHIVNPGYITGAIKHMDSMFKMACGLHRR